MPIKAIGTALISDSTTLLTTKYSYFECLQIKLRNYRYVYDLCAESNLVFLSECLLILWTGMTGSHIWNDLNFASHVVGRFSGHDRFERYDSHNRRHFIHIKRYISICLYSLSLARAQESLN